MKENKLIADFMGVQYKSDEDYIKTLEEMRLHGIGYEQGYMESQLNYHESWDWLIPVVDKCFQEEGKHYVINDALLTINIDEVYEAVVKFIKEYNKKS